MKSLHKAIDILEFILTQEDSPVTPQDISAATGINSATAVRILAVLQERGLTEKLSRRAGYRPGPMVSAMACRENRYRKMAAAARPELAALAALLHLPVNLSVWGGEHRLMICYCSAERNWRPWPTLRLDERLAEAATGRLLCSVLEPSEALRRLGGVYPVPGWPEAVSPETLAHELRRVRKEKFIRFHSVCDRMTVMGGMIDVPGFPAGAVGFGIGNADAGLVWEKLQQCINNIEEKLTCKNEGRFF